VSTRISTTGIDVEAASLMWRQRYGVAGALDLKSEVRELKSSLTMAS